MERACEFCTAYKSVVYCKADAANLCLSCDAKVHSANALSSRHPRTLLCDSCRQRPCTVWCLDHCMYLCHGCDKNLHGVSSEHQRRVVRCYTGCPSAKDFAVMWGFRVIDDNAALARGYGSVISKGRSELPVSFDGTEAGSSGKKKKGKLQRDSGIILEQILELEKLQLSEGNGGSLLTEAATDTSVSIRSVSEDPYRNSTEIHRQSEGRLSDTPQLQKELMVDFSRSMFPQTELLSSSSSSSTTVDNSFWQDKGPSKNYQLWYQNLQDIGVCEETERSEDFDIPDIDLTFRNFEELFGSDQDLVAGNAMISVSSLETGAWLCKSDHNRNARSPRMKRGHSPFDENRKSNGKTEDSLLAVKPISSSSHSLPASRFSGGSSGADYTEEASSCSPLSDNAHLGGRQNAISRLKEKKKARTFTGMSSASNPNVQPRKSLLETYFHRLESTDNQQSSFPL